MCVCECVEFECVSVYVSVSMCVYVCECVYVRLKCVREHALIGCLQNLRNTI